MDLQDIINFRHTLHQHAELSGYEVKTAQLIADKLREFNPTEIITHMGGNGVVAIYNSGIPGPTILFRADIDALPIPENNDLYYKSLSQTASHKCGHDGHSAVLIGLAKSMKENPPQKGQIVLLFQAAEETGQGAKAILEEKRMIDLKPDMVFAFHNIPTFPLHSIIVRKGTFSAASTGIIIKLIGATSHAAEPEKGNNPSQAMADIISFLNKDHGQTHDFQDFILLTIIHARLGEIAFGTNPGYAEIMATLRTFSNDDMERLQQRIEEFSQKRAAKDQLSISFEYVEEFPATINHHIPIKLIQNATQKLNLRIIEKDEPFKWSEDFGWFTNRYPGVLFGIGSGENHPVLHDSSYDFPDEIIETAIHMFSNLITQILEFHN
ncbi:MAG: amidohydrolase [Bacteroidales bacterium]|nr:amidohydrolase [Bacteroidales bacterium]